MNKAKVEPKTVQSILRHSRIQTTLDLYTQGDGEETRAAQGAFLRELALPVAVGNRKPCRFGRWPQMVGNEHGRRKRHLAFCVKRRKDKIRVLGIRGDRAIPSGKRQESGAAERRPRICGSL